MVKLKSLLNRILNWISAPTGPNMTTEELNTWLNSLNRDFRGTVDWVVEEGTDNGWTYTKWDSGKYEAYKYFEDVTITQGYIAVSFPSGIITSQNYRQVITPNYGTSTNRQPRVLFFTTSGYNLYLRTYDSKIPTGMYTWTHYLEGRWK